MPRRTCLASVLVVSVVYALSSVAGCARATSAEFVCVVDATFPASVSKEDPADAYERLTTGTAKRLFPNAIDIQRRCMTQSPAGRASACALLRTPAGKRWSDAVRAGFAKEVRLLDASDKRVSFVEAVGRRVERQSDLRCVGPIEFLVYETGDEREMNAVALPGGTVAIGARLLHALDESGLGFVLGHEVAHCQTVTQSAELLRLIGERKGILDALRRLREMAGAICRGPMAEAYVDFYGAVWARSAGYDPYAGARLFSGGPLDDGLSAVAYSATASHPPGAARSTWAGYAANFQHPKGKWRWQGSAYYRGRVGSLEAWDGRTPPAVEHECAAPRE